MEAQVQNAVELALNPEADHALKQQALSFISQVKDSPDAWRLALALLTNQPPRPTPVRHFALQILDSAIGRSFYNDASGFEQTKAVLMGFLDPEPANHQYVILSEEPQYLHNQVAHSLTLLFILSYTTTWHSFFDDCLALIQSNMARGQAFEPVPIQIFLKVLSMIDEEVADALYTSSKKVADQRMNTEIKDRIRAYDVHKITTFLFQLMTNFESDVSKEELVKLSLMVVGQWITWIDITLIVNDPFIALIYRFLVQPGLRTSASETLANIVSKKMNSEDKLGLITFLNLTQVVNALDANEDVEFSESMARLVNVQGLELTRILTEAKSTTELSSKTLRALRDIFPLLLRFLADDYDDTSMAVFPFLTDLLLQSRRSAKKTGAEVFDRDFLQALLQAIFKKMRDDEDAQLSENEDSEEEAEFHQLRKALFSFQDSIGAMDPELYSRSLRTLITASLQSLNSSPSENWRDVEVALLQIHSFAEPLKVNGLWENSDNPKHFAEILSRLVAVAPKLQHPLNRLLFMEIMVRYTNELHLQPELFPPVLEFFVGALGIHSNEPRVQLRAWYLFERLLTKIQDNIGSMAEQILVAFTDLLRIRVTSASKSSMVLSADSDSVSESERDVIFDNQLYLFQSAGLLIASMRPNKPEVGEALLRSLYINLNEQLLLAPEPSSIAHIHHTIMAIGDVAKGFDGANDQPGLSRQQIGSRLFTPASEVILKALAVLEDSSAIRDAVYFPLFRHVLTKDTLRVYKACHCDGRGHSSQNTSIDRWSSQKEHNLGINRLPSVFRSIDT